MKRIPDREPTDGLIADALLGELDAARAAELERRLARDPERRAEEAELRALWARLGELGTAEAPSSSLRERFYTMLEAYRAGLHDRPPRRDWRERLDDWLAEWWPRRPMTQAGVALATLVIGLIGGRLLLPAAPAPELERLEGRVAELQRAVSLTLLEQPSASDRLAGVAQAREGAARDDEVLQALLTRLENDPSAGVRLAAVDALARFADREAVRRGLVDALPRQDAPAVQVALVDLLLTRGGHDARAAVGALGDDPRVDPAVRTHVERRLRELS